MKAKLLVSTAFLAASVSLFCTKECYYNRTYRPRQRNHTEGNLRPVAEHLGSCIYGGLWVGENSGYSQY